jgi:hypothetical protein
MGTDGQTNKWTDKQTNGRTDKYLLNIQGYALTPSWEFGFHRLEAYQSHHYHWNVAIGEN